MRANRFYEPGENRAARVNDLFAAVAPRYDLINDLQSFGLHRGWKRRLVQLANGRPGERALDLCCGTGDVAFALAEAGFDTTGLDFSEAMLSVARARAARRCASTTITTPPLTPTPTSTAVAACACAAAAPGRRPSFLQGDAQALPFADDSFDVVTVSYGLRNLARWERGLEEMYRVVKPGGRLLVLDCGKPDHPIWRALYYSYLRTVIPLFGRLFCGDAQTYAYILESLKHYPAQHGVAAELQRLGCVETRIVNLLGGVMTINEGQKPGTANHH